MKEVLRFNPHSSDSIKTGGMYQTRYGDYVELDDYLELKNKYDRVLALSDLVMRDLSGAAGWPNSMAVPDYFVELACYQSDILVTKEQEINLSEYQ